MRDGQNPVILLAMRRLTEVATSSYLAAMRVVGIKELKNRLSEYVRLAAGGETVLVADRDQVVAELVPPRAERAPMVRDAMLAQAVREGWLTPALQPKGALPERKPVATLKALLKELDADRADR
jgi:antitoxin (DNA-binding transcriptional repressor) of toxin-antitoxin stability system